MLLIKATQGKKGKNQEGISSIGAAHPDLAASLLFFPKVIPLELAPSRHFPIDIFKSHISVENSITRFAPSDLTSIASHYSYLISKVRKMGNEYLQTMKFWLEKKGEVVSTIVELLLYFYLIKANNSGLQLGEESRSLLRANFLEACCS